MAIPYEADGDRIFAPVQIKDDVRFRFEASALKRERGSTHALLRVVDDHERVLARSQINVDDMKEVTWLANRAHERLNGLRADYTKTALSQDLEAFAAGLWDYQMQTCAAVELPGDTTPRPPAFILKPYLIEGGGTILFAPPGRGKSYTAYLMAIAIDAGVTKFFPLQQRKVLMVNLERSEQSLRSRYGRINAVLGLPPGRTLLTLNARGKALSDVIPLIEREIRGRGVQVVILDSISRAGMGSLVEDQPANRIVDALNGLKVAWLAIGHTPRADESHLFGSMHFEAGADVVVQLLTQVSIQDPARMGVGLRITKQNDIGPQPLKIFAMEFTESGLKAFRPAREDEFPQITRGEQPGLGERITQFLLGQATGQATVEEITKGIDSERSTVSAKLNDLKGKLFIDRKERGPKGRKVWRVLMPGMDRAEQPPLEDLEAATTSDSPEDDEVPEIPDDVLSPEDGEEF